MWIYLIRVKKGYAQNVALMWNGLFQCAGLCGKYAVLLEIAGTHCRLSPVVYASKLRRVRIFPDLPTSTLRKTEVDKYILTRQSYRKKNIAGNLNWMIIILK